MMLLLKAKDVFPEPERPVIITSLFLGRKDGRKLRIRFKKIKAGEDQKNELSGIKDQIQKEEEEQ